MTYSIHYLAGVGARRLGLSAAEVEVPTSDDGYGEFLNGLRHVFQFPHDIDDILSDVKSAREAMQRVHMFITERAEDLS
jgi:hypothetical protein